MKIGLLTGILSYSPKVQEKEDGGPLRDQNRQQGQKKNPSDSSADSQKDADPETIERAVESFQADKQAQVNGLTASVSGQGPGLRVLLKDQNGDVVRRLTGDEFLKLRNASTGDTKVPGKILDQKL